ncbi:MAG: ATP-grasp domain-containing protein, partial [Candidatus Kaiserbacteria bacterium]|nr:ATP-grasp domain-containing protein [Candidatus Kaiserbacteria bacterium]
MSRIIVGVLRGGTSKEYNLSLKTGANILSALPENKYDTRDILVDKSGVWHSRGIPMEAPRALAQIDIVINGLHGGVGEDGTVQRLLDRSGVAYTGSRAGGSQLSLNKIRAREILQEAGLRMPRAVSFNLENELTTGEMAQAVFSQFGPPYIAKPASEGASHGVIFVLNLLELPDAIGDVLDEFGAVIVEEYIRGDEVSAGTIEDFRGQELYALPPAHVRIPDGARFLDSSHHEEASAEHVCPSNFTQEEKRAIEDLARSAHRALGLSHFSRADIINTRRGPYLLEVNALPGLYAGASFPVMLEAVGSSTR